MCDCYSCIFYKMYLIPTQFPLKTLLKHKNVHFLTLDFSQQYGVGCKLSTVITWSQRHNCTQRFREQKHRRNDQSGILKPSSNWSLYKLIISDQTLIKLKWFFAYICAFNGQTLSCVFEQFSFTSKFFWVKIVKIDFFKEKMVLIVVFIKLTFRWLQTGLSDLKNTKQLKFCPWLIFFLHF